MQSVLPITGRDILVPTLRDGHGRVKQAPAVQASAVSKAVRVRVLRLNSTPIR